MSSGSRALISISGVTNASGNATIATPTITQWSTLTAFAQLASGSGIWTAYVSGSNTDLTNPFGDAIGGSVTAGPVDVAPNEYLVLQVTGATPNTQINGTVFGVQNVDPSTLDARTMAGAVNGVAVSGTVDIGNTVPVSDGGLAGSVAQKLSQFTLITSVALPANTTTTINTGLNTANPYPQNAASWQLVITGLQASAFGCRVIATKQDGSGNALGYVQRDSSNIGTLDKIIDSGILDAPAMQFAITIPSGAPNGCNVDIYTTASLIQDNFYDTGIYENTSAQAGFFSPGYDGILTTVSNTIGAGGNQTYPVPTYRGPVQIGVEMTQAGHLVVQELTYLGSVISAKTNIPVSSSGLAQQIFIVFLAGMSNEILTFNDDSGASNVFFLEVRAIKDLLD